MPSPCRPSQRASDVPTALQTPAQAAQWLAERVALLQGGRLRAHSRDVRPGDGFIAWPGHAQDGRQFVGAALAAGAAACLVEADGAEAFALGGGRVATLPGASAEGGWPTPSVPMTPQRRPSRVSACAVHHAVLVLPLVPVLATTLKRRLGAP